MPGACLSCGKRLARGNLCTLCTPADRVSLTPPYCFRCQTPMLHYKFSSCPACRLFPPLFERLRYLWSYNDSAARALINCMKYRPADALAKVAGKIMANNIARLFTASKKWDLIVPIPSSKQSYKVRLFNQCAILARELRLIKPAECKIAYRTLRHVGYKEVQASLPHARRINNVKAAFFSCPHDVSGKSILLIDDVITTGATTSAACLSLLKSGAESVDILALARAEVWQEYRSRIYKAIR